MSSSCEKCVKYVGMLNLIENEPYELQTELIDEWQRLFYSISKSTADLSLGGESGF